MAEDVLKIPGELDLDRKRAAAEYRRCILLLLLASTSPNNPTLKKLLADGLLATIKSWLDDTLNGAIGTGLLLFITSSIRDSLLNSSLARFTRLQEALICYFIFYLVLPIYQ